MEGTAAAEGTVAAAAGEDLDRMGIPGRRGTPVVVGVDPAPTTVLAGDTVAGMVDMVEAGVVMTWVKWAADILATVGAEDTLG